MGTTISGSIRGSAGCRLSAGISGVHAYTGTVVEAPLMFASAGQSSQDFSEADSYEYS